MANVPRSSFIPKQVTMATPKKVRHTRVFSILGFISGTLLFLSLVAAGGVFVLKGVEEGRLEDQRSFLSSERAKFNEDDIAEIRAFDRRIELARSLLDAHISPSKIFAALEANTKASVQYTSLAYVRRPSGDVSVDLFGVTDDFAKVALQSMQNSEDFILKDMEVTEVGIGLQLSNEEGAAVQTSDKAISFKLISNIPASKLLYESNVTADTQSVSIPEATTTPAVEEEIPAATVPVSTTPASEEATSTESGASNEPI